MRRIRTIVPANVLSYSEAAPGPTVTVEVARPLLDERRRAEHLKPIPKVPIAYPSFGGFAVYGPLERGDEVLLLVADRAIWQWLETGAKYTPRGIDATHSLSDCVALPVSLSKGRRAALRGSGRFVVGKTDGTASVSFAASGSEVTVEGATVKLGSTAAQPVLLGDAVVAAMQAFCTTAKAAELEPALAAAATALELTLNTWKAAKAKAE